MVRTIIKDTPNKIGEVVTLNGWVHSRRDHGKIIFLDLRDRSGLVQVVGDQILDPLKPESVVEITGLIKARPEKLINSHLATGSIEIEAQSATLISPAKELPLPIDGNGYDIDESVRLKYRYLDLRRPRLQNNLRLRSQLTNLIRQHLIKQDFVEIETGSNATVGWNTVGKGGKKVFKLGLLLRGKTNQLKDLLLDFRLVDTNTATTDFISI